MKDRLIIGLLSLFPLSMTEIAERNKVYHLLTAKQLETKCKDLLFTPTLTHLSEAVCWTTNSC